MASDTENEDVVTIIRLFNNSACREFRFRKGALELTLKKPKQLRPQPSFSPPPTVAQTQVINPKTPPDAPAHPQASVDVTPPIVDGTAIKAPMLGIFYRAASPDTPPFIEIGQRVESGDTLCIIEVMKVMNRFVALKAGIVEAIYPANAMMIEFGETIMVIKEDAEP